VGCTPVWAVLWMWPWPHEELPLQGDFFCTYADWEFRYSRVSLFVNLITWDSSISWMIVTNQDMITWLASWLHLLCRDCANHCHLTESLFCINSQTQGGFKTHCTMQEYYLIVFKLYSDELQMAYILIWNSFHIFVLNAWNLEC
jgi:hypothetical protein